MTFKGVHGSIYHIGSIIANFIYSPNVVHLVLKVWWPQELPVLAQCFSNKRHPSRGSPYHEDHSILEFVLGPRGASRAAKIVVPSS